MLKISTFEHYLLITCVCRWWKEGRDTDILNTLPEYTIQTVDTGSVGRYYCQPTNQLGQVKELSFCHKLTFMNLISLQPDGVNL